MMMMMTKTLSVREVIFQQRLHVIFVLFVTKLPRVN